MSIASTIREQIMHLDFWLLARLGAHQYVDTGNGLRFKVRGFKYNYIEIELDGNDLYTVKYIKATVKKYHKEEENNIYFDMLPKVIEDKMKKAAA